MNNTPNQLNTPESCLHKIVEEITVHFPKNIAIRCDGQKYLYTDLNKYSNQLAHKIIDKIGSGPANIAILFENNYELIVSILAILKAGKSFVPLEINFPLARNKAIIDDARCELILSKKKHLNKAQQLTDDNSIICVDDDLSNFSKKNVESGSTPESLAFIVYTSGSTGNPKGAKHTHRSFIHLVMRFNEICPSNNNDIFGIFLSPAFSAHAFIMFTALLNGSCLSLYNIKSNMLSVFLHWFEKEKISVSMMIPSFLRHVLAVIENKKTLGHLRNLIIGGESLYRSDVEKLRKFLKKNTSIINILASTETYVCCALVFDSDTLLKGNNIPVGYPVKDMDIAIIDENGNNADINKIGKIRISSKYISTGYWNDDLNRDIICREKEDKDIVTFNSSDLGYIMEDGCIVHVGREENFIKLRGFRINLNEITNILLENKDVSEAICIMKKNQVGAEQIIAYLVPASDNTPDIEFLKVKLVRLLPDYMIPSHFVILEKLPNNSSGKTDLKKLPDIEWGNLQENSEYTKAGSKLETEIVGIFESSLKIKPIGIRNNFMKIGADSLSLFLVFNKIEKKYNIKLKVDSILNDPTIEALARTINNQIKFMEVSSYVHTICV